LTSKLSPSASGEDFFDGIGGGLSGVAPQFAVQGVESWSEAVQRAGSSASRAPASAKFAAVASSSTAPGTAKSRARCWAAHPGLVFHRFIILPSSAIALL